jgi:undecaprenyl-diphosphatase
MDFLLLLKSILLGIIEGITEWLPVSSTGHIILFDKAWNSISSQATNPAFDDFFLYFIQLGAILSVIILFFGKLCPFKLHEKTSTESGSSLLKRVYSDKTIWTMWGKVAVACIPCVIVGILADISDQPWVIALALIVYGIGFLVIEKWNEKRKPQTNDVYEITWSQAAIIGMAQALSVIPGTSRSGVTILAALLLGISRPAGAEFTFFLAIPVMLGASLLKIVKNFSEVLAFGVEWVYLLTGFAVAFAVSMLCIKLLMNFVKKHDFKVFGWYRIALGLVVLGVFIVPLLFA